MFEKNVVRIGGQIGDGAAVFVAVLLAVRFRIEQPFEVRPEETEVGLMRTAFLIGVRVVNAVRADPTDRSSLQRQRAEQRDGILERLGEAQTAMREETMKPK